jgi:hypothetical protein
MKEQDLQLANVFLELKAKSAKGVSWTRGDRSTIRRTLREKGEVGALAACCVLASHRREDRSKALDILSRAMESGRPSRLVELSIYEALTCVRIHELAAFAGSIFPFVDASLSRRSVDLDNVIVLLGRLARTGSKRAMSLLHSLLRDSDAGLRDNASIVLKGLNAQ